MQWGGGGAELYSHWFVPKDKRAQKEKIKVFDNFSHICVFSFVILRTVDQFKQTLAQIIIEFGI